MSYLDTVKTVKRVLVADPKEAFRSSAHLRNRSLNRRTRLAHSMSQTSRLTRPRPGSDPGPCIQLGSSDPTVQFSRVPAFVVATIVYFFKRCVVLAVIAGQINWHVLKYVANCVGLM